jgi:PAS domain S-box-containing protein
MPGKDLIHERISELESLLSVTERKADILTNLLKEANAEFEEALELVQKSRVDLESRVEDRTSELAAANEELRREIADREATEQALRCSEERYRTLVESSFDGIFVQRAGKIAFANTRLAEMLGYERDEIEGRDYFCIYYPEERQLIYDRAAAPLQLEPPPLQYEVRLQRKDGSALEVEMNARIATFEGDVATQICVRDITERKRLEQQLLQAQRLEGIGRLAGGVAHDFNNLLTAIIGYSDILLIKTSDGDPFRDKIQQINRAAERAAQLTAQLLAFSRKQVLEVKVLDLNHVVRDFEKILHRVVGEDIELFTHLHPDLGKVRADPSRIEQILMNLAVNARDAMPDGGKLTIETSNMFLDEPYAQRHPEVQPGPHVMVAVSDSGNGMDAGTLSRIFDPFFTTKEKGKGTGLGLSTLYGIVKQHQGHISVYSEPGQGTVFKVYLPLVSESVELVPQDAEAFRKPTGHETVLVVEDDKIVRDLACEFLQELGYSVISAESPGQAIEISSRYPGSIDLLLTDVVMPGMDGPRLYRQLSPSRPAMRVLFMSGYSENLIATHGVLNPGIHFIPKPFTMNSLASKVRETLDDRHIIGNPSEDGGLRAKPELLV